MLSWPGRCLWLVSLALALAPSAARAGCNLIAVSALEAPSTGFPSAGPSTTTRVNGYVNRPIAGPGDFVTVRADLGCVPGNPGFALPGSADPNLVRLRFHSPSAGAGFPVNEVTVPAGDVSPTRCGSTRCKALQFTMPDTGFTGPAEILVQRTISGSPQVVARVFELYQTTHSCDPLAWQPEARFGTFTALPPRTDLAEGTTPAFVGAVDGYGNLLVPLGFRDVLQAQAGAPIATILKVVSANAALLNALEDPASASDDLRTYNVFGRPIPPVMRLVKDPLPMAPPAFVGTTDVLESVLQVLPLGTPPLEYAELMASGTGPVTLFDATVSVQSAAPLRALRTSLEALAVGVDEELRGDLNSDGDATDLVVEITQVETGAVTNTGMALVEAAAPATELQLGPKAVLSTTGDVVAFLQSEAHSGAPCVGVCTVPAPPGVDDQNGDGDGVDSILRVFRGSGAELTSAPLIAADPTARIDGRRLATSSNALGEPSVFFLRREQDASTPATLGTGDGTSPFNRNDDPSLSADGTVVAWTTGLFETFMSPPTCADLILASDASATAFLLSDPKPINPTCAGFASPCGAGFTAKHSRHPSMNADGSLVAFDSTWTLLHPGSALAQVLVAGFDVDDPTPPTPCFTIPLPAASTLDLVSSAFAFDGTGGNGASSHASISADGLHVAFQSLASDLIASGTDTNGVSDVFVRDRTLGTTVRVSVGSGGAQADGASYSAALNAGNSFTADGQLVLFVSDATNLVAGDTNGVADVFVANRDFDGNGVFDEGPPFVRRISVTEFEDQANGPSESPAASGSGLVFAFASTATNMVADDSNGFSDIFVYNDAFISTPIERISVSSAGAQGNGASSQPSVSGDGRFVSFTSEATNLVPGDANGVADVFRFDRITRTLELASVDSAGAQGNAASGNSVISADAAVVGMETLASNLGPSGGDTDGGLLDIAFRARSGSDLNGDADGVDTVLAAFRAGADEFSSTLVNSATEASVVSVAGGRALFVGPGAEAYLFDPAVAPGPTNPRNLASGTTHAAVGLSAQAACVMSTGGDLFAGEPGLLFSGAFPLSNTTRDGSPNAVAALGGNCVVVLLESLEEAGELGCGPTEPAGGCDLNGDGDAQDPVLAFLSMFSTTVVDWAATDFRADPANPDLIAFRTPEAWEHRPGARRPECGEVTGDAGGCDLNGDGDDADLVMQVVNVATGEVTNLGRAAYQCIFDACDAFELYRVRADSTVSFLGREIDQAVGFGCLPSSPDGACDLDGNGFGTDVVVHVVKLTPDVGGTLIVRASQVLPAEPEAETPYFPDTQIDRTIVNVAKSECRAAQIGCCTVDVEDPICAVAIFDTSFVYAPGSCAAQYDTDPLDQPGELDCETLRDWIVGDSDLDGADGVLDVGSNGVLDICLDVENPTQQDADGDALGDGADSCDPDPASDPPSELDCDLNGDAHIDRRDIDLIVEAVPGEAVGFPAPGWDRRDRNGDALLTSFDTALCRAECTRPNCKIPGACGLLGAEALLPLGLAAWLARRRRRSRSSDARRAARTGAVVLFGAGALAGDPASALVLSLTPTSVVEQAGVPFDVDLTISGLGAPPWLRAVTVKLSFDASEVAFLGATPGADLGFACAPFDPNPLCDASFTASASPAGVVTFVETSFLSDLSTQPSSFTLATFSFEGLPPPGVESSSTISVVVDAFTELVVEDAMGMPSLAPFSPPLPSVDVTILPEPGTALLVGAGLVALGAPRMRAGRRL